MKKNVLKKICIGILSISMALNLYMPVYAEETIQDERQDDENNLEGGTEGNREVLALSWTGTIESGTRCYYDEKGEKVTGLQEIEGHTYYFDEDGVLQTGWQKAGEKEYYFSPETGERYEDRTEVIDEVKYSFDREGNAVQVPAEDNEGSEDAVKEEDIQKKPEEVYGDAGQKEGNNEKEEEKEVKNEEVKARTGWDISGEQKYYIMPNGKKHTGWLSFGKTYYYCGSDGAVVYGKQKIGDSWYYFDQEGIRQQGKWIKEEGKNKYYALPDGKLVTGWLSFGKTYYYCRLDGSVAYGKLKIGNAWYYFDKEGIRQQGKWIEEEGKKKYYALPDGKLCIGWLSFGKTYYYCGSDGEIIKDSTYNVKGICYYFDEQGVRQKLSAGWKKKDEKRRYYALPDGTVHTGWLSFGKTYYYCGKDGFILYGRQKIGNDWYYFDEEGIRQQGKWIKEEGKNKYYAMPDGKLRVGWLSFGSTYYYCGQDGEIVKNRTCNIDGICYYFNEQGVRQKLTTGWKSIDKKKRYYVLPDGTVHTGWLSFGKTYYYCGKDGLILYGKQKIGSNWYYFDEEGIRQQSNWILENGKKRYYAFPDGKLVTGWLSFGSTYYYCRLDGEVAYGKLKIGNSWYYFNESGIRQQGRWIREEGKNRYYALPDGKLVTGWLSFGSTYYYCKSDAGIVTGETDYPVDGIKYTFDADGIMKKESGWGSYNGNKYYKNPATGHPYKNQWVSFGQTYYYANAKGHMVSGWQTIGGYRYYFDPATKVMARNTTIDGIKIGSNGRVLNYQERMSIFSTVSTNDANGTYNMSRALKSFNQVVIMPGQTLSFFSVAGPCGAAQGYLPAGVVGGVGYGGGICQASTTLYGAVLRAGLTIVERGNHSIPSTYVPIGQDAMVDYGTSDLKIRNDYSFPVKIVTYVNGNTLYAEVWGNQPNWYDHVEISSWWTGSNSAIAYRNYIKNGKVVKTEQLPGSFYY